MKVMTAQDFGVRTGQGLPAEQTILLTPDGRPEGIYVPWDQADVSPEIRRELLGRLGDAIRERRETGGLTEEDVLRDFARARASRSGRR